MRIGSDTQASRVPLRFAKSLGALGPVPVLGTPSFRADERKLAVGAQTKQTACLRRSARKGEAEADDDDGAVPVAKKNRRLTPTAPKVYLFHDHHLKADDDRGT